jgi:hypothetical protein
MDIYGFKGSSDSYKEIETIQNGKIQSSEFQIGSKVLSIGGTREYVANDRGGFIFIGNPEYSELMNSSLLDLQYGISLDDIMKSFAAKMDAPYIVIGADKKRGELSAIRSDLPLYIAQNDDDFYMSANSLFISNFSNTYTRIDGFDMITPNGVCFEAYNLERKTKTVVKPTPIGVDTIEIISVSYLEKVKMKDLKL